MPAPSLLLFAHGTSDGAGAAIADSLVADLRRAGGFSAVEAAFALQPPAPAAALTRLPPGPVAVMPLLTTGGYIAGSVLPRLLAEAGATGHAVDVLPPLGLDTEIPGLVAGLADAAITGAGLDPRTVAVLVAGHGSSRSDASARATRGVAAALAGRYGETGTLFLSEAPTADAWRTVTGRACVVVVPFFLSGGHHEDDDLPALLRAGGGIPDGTPAQGRRLWLTPSVGRHPALPDLIRRRALARFA
ncbi:CbiX/SirB N-terminal domain-containing protein [Azospirillum halopraeferens]|uniref:CbiX/SirB N-terminal domain-containing protein n=1 Tax=Azospirillum halopraeferens TaxID=34010 RepID=UPI00040B878E|nr:CbiX/SirB N-terminal domain-containing protein [Azospirillum halopraeferens]